MIEDLPSMQETPDSHSRTPKIKDKEREASKQANKQILKQKTISNIIMNFQCVPMMAGSSASLVA